MPARAQRCASRASSCAAAAPSPCRQPARAADSTIPPGPQPLARPRAPVRDALADGPMIRDELGVAVTAWPTFRHLGFAFADRAGTFLKPLAWQGDMSFGPPRDGRVTFQRLDRNPRWAGVPDVDEAGMRAGEAYSRAYGPATPDHVHYWLGEGLGAGRKRIQSWIAGFGERLRRPTSTGSPSSSYMRISRSWPRRPRRLPCASCRDTTNGSLVRARPTPTSCRLPGGRWSAVRQATFGQAHHSRRQEGPGEPQPNQARTTKNGRDVTDSAAQGQRRARYGGRECRCH